MEFNDIERIAMVGGLLPKGSSFMEQACYLGLRSLYNDYRSGNVSKENAKKEKEILRVSYAEWTERERRHARDIDRQVDNIRKSEDLLCSIMRKHRDGAGPDELFSECISCIAALTGNTVIEKMITEE